jgi:hypothetical protein
MKVDYSRFSWGRATWEACQKWQAKNFSWPTAVTAVQLCLFVLLDDRLSLCLYCEECVYIHTLSDRVQTLYEYPLLPHNTPLALFLHTPGAVRSICWLYTVRSESRCALIKTRFSIERIIVSWNWIKNLHTLQVLHFNAPAACYPRERPGTHCTGGWVGPRAGLDRCGKSHPHRDSISGPSSP